MDVRCFSVVWIDERCCVGNVCGPTGWVFPDQASESFFAHWSLINITIQTNLSPMSFQKKTQRNWFINHIITPALTSTLVWYCYFFWARYWMAKLNPGKRHPRKDFHCFSIKKVLESFLTDFFIPYVAHAHTFWGKKSQKEWIDSSMHGIPQMILMAPQKKSAL